MVRIGQFVLYRSVLCFINLSAYQCIVAPLQRFIYHWEHLFSNRQLSATHNKDQYLIQWINRYATFGPVHLGQQIYSFSPSQRIQDKHQFRLIALVFQSINTNFLKIVINFYKNKPVAIERQICTLPQSNFMYPLVFVTQKSLQPGNDSCL